MKPKLIENLYYDGAKMNLVPLEMLTDPVTPGKQVVDVGGILQFEHEHRLIAINFAAIQHAPAHLI